MKMKWLLDNFWIKVLSLVLAIIVWIYVHGEVSRVFTP